MSVKAALLPALLVPCVLLMVQTASAVETEADGGDNTAETEINGYSRVTTQLCEKHEDCVRPTLSGRCIPAKRCACSSYTTVIVAGNCSQVADFNFVRDLELIQIGFNLINITGEEYNCSQQPSVCERFDNSGECDENSGLCKCAPNHYFIQDLCRSQQTGLICQNATGETDSDECMGITKVTEYPDDTTPVFTVSNPFLARTAKIPYPLYCLRQGFCQCKWGLIYQWGKGCVKAPFPFPTTTTTPPSTTEPLSNSSIDNDTTTETPPSSEAAPATCAVSVTVAATLIWGFLAASAF